MNRKSYTEYVRNQALTAMQLSRPNPAAKEISADVEAYLKAGGKITELPSPNYSPSRKVRGSDMI